MMTRKTVASLALAPASLLVAIGSSVIGLPAAALAPVGSAFTYQGQLKDAGQPYNGNADLAFRLFDAVTGGNQVGAAVIKSSHPITDGLLTVDLDFGAGAFDGNERWLALSVNGVALTPRQPVRPTPYALFALNTPAGSGSPWQLTTGGIYYNSGDVGIGTASPLELLHVEKTPVPSTAETVARFSVADAGGNYLSIGNASGLDTKFDSMVKSFQVGSGGPALTLEAETNQDGSVNAPVIVMNARSTSGALGWRPLFGVNNNGSEVLRVTHDGDVGIGTDTPSAKLHVGGTPGVDGIRFPDGTLQLTAATGGTGGSVWQPSGSDIYYSAGNVGIGTTAPSAPLSFGNSLSDSKLRIWDGGTDVGMGLGVQEAQFRLHLNAIWDRFSFLDGPAGNEIMTITGLGSVGIGTPLPAQRLDVRGQLQVRNSIRLDAADDPMIVRQFDPMTSGRLQGFGRWGMFMEPSTLVLGIPGSDVGLKSLRVGAWNLDGTRDDWLTVSNAGDVGINKGMYIDGANTNDGTSLVSGLKFGGGSGEGIASKRTPGAYQFQLDFYTRHTKRMSVTNAGDLELVKADGSLVHRMGSNHMISTFGSDGQERMRLWSDAWGGFFLWDQSHDNTVYMSAGNESGGELVLRDAAGNTTIMLDADQGGSGRVTTQILEITGGSDLSEQFDVTGVNGRIEPGMVVSIDRTAPGKLVVSSKAYDRTVAGILSGAGGVRTGMMMSQSGSVADGDHPVALSGRVWTWCDASDSAIQPGDLLTTSDTPGHAMKVVDHGKAQGAMIGKAMTPLETGKGLVLVLVALQ